MYNDVSKEMLFQMLLKIKDISRIMLLSSVSILVLVVIFTSSRLAG